MARQDEKAVTGQWGDRPITLRSDLTDSDIAAIADVIAECSAACLKALDRNVQSLTEQGVYGRRSVSQPEEQD